MAKKNKKESKISKKEIAVTIFAQMDAALSDYQSIVGEKKFISHLKKLAKSLAGDIVEGSKKEKEKFEKEAKRSAKKKSVEKKTKTAKKAVSKKNTTKKIKASKTEAPQEIIQAEAIPHSAE